MIYHKCQAIIKKILDCKSDSKQLFSIVSGITNNKPSNPLTDNKTDEELANDFAYFFNEKIRKIRDQFVSVEEFKSQINDIPQLECIRFLILLLNQFGRFSLKQN